MPAEVQGFLHPWGMQVHPRAGSPVLHVSCWCVPVPGGALVTVPPILLAGQRKSEGNIFSACSLPMQGRL